ncbi:MAG TPA: peptide ABC transporter ATP-binding protein [Leptospiraceae bacterium]|nr:peptide ABC transporter ATP-binding protein [Spirochaetaceae bacterium]HBS05163.1 peptide ABC transporter ATP-binding protein [Leptospiraceae bacterium]|tara:strand:+ start:48205 stop:49158 length:954 start_codon:yes stop_codon:yes gene_type:complete
MTAVLSVENLSIGIGATGITDNVSFTLEPGQIYGIVGESGCGKTITALSCLGMLPEPGGRLLNGRILFKGEDIYSASPERLRQIRGAEISMIFQEPTSALNPLLTIRKQLVELFEFHEFSGDPEARMDQVLRRVGFSDPERILASYPHQLSGGMLQRVVISLALLLHPSLIIADEPTTALDVTVQAQIMELLVELQKEEGCAVLLITHNIGLIAQYADRVGVMYAGHLIEERDVSSFLRNPYHPYSQGLMAALPDVDERKELRPIAGQVPSVGHFPEGCRFRPRCSKAFDPCDRTVPTFQPEPDQKVCCYLYQEAVV